MKALCWHGKKDIRCDNVPDPQLILPQQRVAPIPPPEPCIAGLEPYRPTSSNAFEPELFRRTALLACESEILEFPTKQNWFDTDNDHFRSAVGTC